MSAGAQSATAVTLTLTSQAAAAAAFTVSHLPALGQDGYEVSARCAEMPEH